MPTVFLLIIQSFYSNRSPFPLYFSPLFPLLYFLFISFSIVMNLFIFFFWDKVVRSPPFFSVLFQ